MWDGRAYDVVATVQERWGDAILERNAWRGDEVVLDAGVGTGRLLRALLTKIPRGQVVGVDADASMLAAARARLADLPQPDRVRLVQADLAALPLAPESFDVAFSNAVIHWISDKIAVWSGFMRLLRPEGRVTAQFGGDGNLRRIRAAIYRTLRQLSLPATLPSGVWFFQPAADTREQLKICGFRQVRVWEEETPAEFADQEAFTRFCEAVILRPFRTRLEAEAWREFLAAFPAHAYALLGGWRADYVRQNIEARR